MKFANSNKLWLQSFDTLNSSLAKKKSCATKTFLLWFTLYLAVSKALGGWYSIGRFNGGFSFFALWVYGAYIWVTYFRNFTVWHSTRTEHVTFCHGSPRNPRSRRRNYVRIRDRRMLTRWLWRSWCWPWFLCATPTLGSKRKSKITTSVKILARSLNPTANWELDNGNSCCVCA